MEMNRTDRGSRLIRGAIAFVIGGVVEALSHRVVIN